MKEYICPICQKEFVEGSVPEQCPECGCDKDLFNVIDDSELKENVSESLESTNGFSAEHTANTIAEVIAIIGVIIGIIGVIGGIVLIANDNGISGFFSIIGGISLFILYAMNWAVIKMMTNVSYRLTRLDNKFNPYYDKLLIKISETLESIDKKLKTK